MIKTKLKNIKLFFDLLSLPNLYNEDIFYLLYKEHKVLRWYFRYERLYYWSVKYLLWKIDINEYLKIGDILSKKEVFYRWFVLEVYMIKFNKNTIYIYDEDWWNYFCNRLFTGKEHIEADIYLFKNKEKILEKIY